MIEFMGKCGRMARRIAVIAALGIAIVVLLSSCLERKNLAAYSTHVVLHGDAVARLGDLESVIRTLEPFDVVIAGEPAFLDLVALGAESVLSRTLIYFDFWGSSSFAGGPIQPRPGDVGDPPELLEWTPGRGVYCYTIPGTQMVHGRRFAGWVRDALSRYPQVKGVFLDDWAPDRFWWAGDERVKARVWPEFPSNSFVWREVQETEKLITRVVYEALGRDGLVVCNGPGRTLATSKRFAEHAGGYPEGRNSWAILDSDDSYRGFKAYDFINVSGWNREGAMTTATKANLRRAIDIVIAHEGKGSIGLSYFEKPMGGGSASQLGRDEFRDPQNWPRYRLP